MQIIHGDCLEKLKTLPSNSVDLIVTDPPYGYSFMGKDWDKAVPSVDIWKECLRVLKDGAFAFIMSAPRQDVLSQMIVRLGMAGFDTNFTSIYWAYSSGFPKAANMGKKVDKKLGVESKVVGEVKLGGTAATLKGKASREDWYDQGEGGQYTPVYQIKEPTSEAGKKLDGAFAGFQPKPAVEIIIVVMKPITEATYLDQAMKNGKGVTWLDDCRIPYAGDGDKSQATPQGKCTANSSAGARPDAGENLERTEFERPDLKGRFPANLIVSDDSLGSVESVGAMAPVKSGQKGWGGEIYGKFNSGGDDGKSFYSDMETSKSFSRYFDLDKWAVEKGIKDSFPFLVCPKASKSEKNKGLENTNLPEKVVSGESNAFGVMGINTPEMREKRGVTTKLPKYKNFHPTVKPVKLMTYLITLGSRGNDTILDPFMGSGTTGVATKLLGRNFIGIELNKEYIDIAEKRIESVQEPLL